MTADAGIGWDGSRSSAAGTTLRADAARGSTVTVGTACRHLAIDQLFPVDGIPNVGTAFRFYRCTVPKCGAVAEEDGCGSLTRGETGLAVRWDRLGAPSMT